MFFFFNDTATTEIYTLSLHDALPICVGEAHEQLAALDGLALGHGALDDAGGDLGAHVHLQGLDRRARSEEHTSELQSRSELVCRLLLENKSKRGVHRDLGKDEFMLDS